MGGSVFINEQEIIAEVPGAIKRLLRDPSLNRQTGIKQDA
jgi:hypothetical protein